VPEVSRFLEILVYRYFNEHNPPHFHAEYNEFKASISIDTLGVVEGRLHPELMTLVVEWAQEHQDELLENWKSIQEMGNTINQTIGVVEIHNAGSKQSRVRG